MEGRRTDSERKKRIKEEREIGREGREGPGGRDREREDVKD